VTNGTLWHQVHDDLRDRITSRQLPPGARLPPEPELMAAHSVRSRGTINRAVRELISEGLIDGQRRVMERKPIVLRISDEETITFIEDVVAAGHVVSPPGITVKIEGDHLVREVYREVDGEPHNWARWRFPMKLAQGTALAYDTDIPRGSIRYLKEGLGWDRLVQKKRIRVRPPSPPEAALLAMPPAWNVIIEYRTGTQDGTVLFEAQRFLRADRTELIP
jgi:GntR family transcriptional regulator